MGAVNWSSLENTTLRKSGSRNTTLQISGCVGEMCLCLCQLLKDNLVVNYLSLASFSDNSKQLPQGIMKLLKSQLLTWLFSCCCSWPVISLHSVNVVAVKAIWDLQLLFCIDQDEIAV